MATGAEDQYWETQPELGPGLAAEPVVPPGMRGELFNARRLGPISARRPAGRQRAEQRSKPAKASGATGWRLRTLIGGTCAAQGSVGLCGFSFVQSAPRISVSLSELLPIAVSSASTCEVPGSMISVRVAVLAGAAGKHRYSL